MSEKEATSKTFKLRHSIEVDAPGEEAWRLINAVDEWADTFPPCQGARVVEKNDNELLIEVTAKVGDGVRTWRSLRSIQADKWRADFRQVDPFPPVDSMTGYWQVKPTPTGGCEIILAHDFATSDETAAKADPPRSAIEAAEWITNICNANSDAELAAFRTACERVASA